MTRNAYAPFSEQMLHGSPGFTKCHRLTKAQWRLHRISQHFSFSQHFARHSWPLSSTWRGMIAFVDGFCAREALDAVGVTWSGQRPRRPSQPSFLLGPSQPIKTGSSPVWPQLQNNVNSEVRLGSSLPRRRQVNIGQRMKQRSWRKDKEIVVLGIGGGGGRQQWHGPARLVSLFARTSSHSAWNHLNQDLFARSTLFKLKMRYRVIIKSSYVFSLSKLDSRFCAPPTLQWRKGQRHRGNATWFALSRTHWWWSPESGERYLSRLITVWEDCGRVRFIGCCTYWGRPS